MDLLLLDCHLTENYADVGGVLGIMASAFRMSNINTVNTGIMKSKVGYQSNYFIIDYILELWCFIRIVTTSFVE